MESATIVEILGQFSGGSSFQKGGARLHKIFNITFFLG